MIVGNDWFSPTRVTGLFSYTISLCACVWRWLKLNSRAANRSVFQVLGAVQLALLLDIAFDIRWRLHAFWMGRAIALNVYAERRWPQLLALLLLCGLLILGLVWIARRFGSGRGVAVAMAGATLSVGLWCCEILSYHYMDLILYRMVGKLMTVSLLWLGFAIITCAGVWWDGNS